MFDWWGDLSGDLRVFYLIGIIAGLFLLIQILLLSFGADLDTDADVDVDAVDGDFGFLSIRSLTAFFFGFGWAGVAAKEAERSTTTSILIGLGVGLALFILVGLLWQQFAKLRESGSVEYSHAIGQTGSVYLAIPPRRSRAGKVEVMVQGRLVVIDAYSESDETISSNARVRIVDVIDPSTVLVEKA